MTITRTTKINKLPENTCTVNVQSVTTLNGKLKTQGKVKNFNCVSRCKIDTSLPGIKEYKKIKLEHCKDSQSRGKPGSSGEHRGNKERCWTVRDTDKERETVRGNESRLSSECKHCVGPGVLANWVYQNFRVTTFRPKLHVLSGVVSPARLTP